MVPSGFASHAGESLGSSSSASSLLGDDQTLPSSSSPGESTEISSLNGDARNGKQKRFGLRFFKKKGKKKHH
ncbi:hypothetical protein FRC03_002480 [Tulasnella sp. 419]|nr:hypothetical protein FRC03_002480 [Tulasnella sp. 419]